MIESALEAGFASAGVDVLLTGPLPTPGVAYLTRALRLEPGRRDQRLAQPVRRQRHQVLLGARREAARRLGAGRSRRRSSSRRSGSTRRSLGKARRLDDARGRYIEFCKSTFGSDLSLQGPEDRRRRGPRRGLPRRARRLPRTRRRGGRDRLQPGRPEHQRRRRRHRAAGAGRGGAASTAPTTASRSTATPTGCRSSTPPAASTTATNCST